MDMLSAVPEAYRKQVEEIANIPKDKDNVKKSYQRTDERSVLG